MTESKQEDETKTKEDATMTDASSPSESDKATNTTTEAVPPPLPPLQAAAWRLEKSLGSTVTSTAKPSTSKGTASTTTTSMLQQFYQFSNPAKRVRRWLSTSSGVAAQATVADIGAAARSLFDPSTSSSSSSSPLLPVLQALPEEDTSNMAVEQDTSKQVTFAEDEAAKYLQTSAVEVQVWLWSLYVRLLWRQQQQQSNNDKDAALAVTQHCRTGIAWATQLVQHSSSSSASLYPLIARLWRFLVWMVLDKDESQALEAPQTIAAFRAELAQAHNAALLRRDLDTSATLLNCMLRELLHYSQVEQAQKLLSNSTFPSLPDGSGGTSSSGGSSSTTFNNNNQLCRYLYYSGRIQALRLDYTNAYASLTQSLRKAPTNTALGFRIAVQRLLIVVQLLMGEIPERSVFFFTKTDPQDPTVQRRHQVGELEPYLHITQAVRRGDLAVFTKVVSQHKARLQADETFTLISRLAHQVVKAGLRKLQTCYSRLSLQDVAQRLGLANAQQAEFVVAKAVRDGVLDATIHHQEQYVQSHELQNVYGTKEPAQAFHRRIAYCLTTHNDAVRAMRYPPDAYKKQLEASRSGSARRRKGDDDKTDEEKAQELEDELEEDY